MDASDITKNKRLNIAVSSYKYGIGKTAIARAQGNPTTNNNIKTALAITKQDKGEPAASILPTITFVGYSSPNATLSYTSGTYTVSEYGFMVDGKVNYSISNGTNILNLKNYIFPTPPNLSITFTVDAYLVYDGITIMSPTYQTITLGIEFSGLISTPDIDVSGIARCSYSSDYTPDEVGFVDSDGFSNYQAGTSISNTITVNAFLKFGQIATTKLHPYIRLGNNYYTASSDTLYNWLNYLAFISIDVDGSGTMSLTFNTKSNSTISTVQFANTHNYTRIATLRNGKYSATAMELSDGQTDLYSAVITFIEGTLAASFSSNVGNVFSPLYTWSDYLGFQLNIDNNGYVSYSINSPYVLDSNPLLSGDTNLVANNITITKIPQNLLTPNVGSSYFQVIATGSINGSVITSTAYYDFGAYVGATIQRNGDYIEVTYNGNLSDYKTAIGISFEANGQTYKYDRSNVNIYSDLGDLSSGTTYNVTGLIDFDAAFSYSATSSTIFYETPSGTPPP